jgi:hypothetical protein
MVVVVKRITYIMTRELSTSQEVPTTRHKLNVRCVEQSGVHMREEELEEGVLQSEHTE